jgi:hypothetical protein
MLKDFPRVDSFLLKYTFARISCPHYYTIYRNKINSIKTERNVKAINSTMPTISNLSSINVHFRFKKENNLKNKC